MKNKKELNIFDKNQLKVAYDTLKLSEIGAMILGGPNHDEAKKIIFKLTGKIIK